MTFYKKSWKLVAVGWQCPICKRFHENKKEGCLCDYKNFVGSWSKHTRNRQAKWIRLYRLKRKDDNNG